MAEHLKRYFFNLIFLNLFLALVLTSCKNPLGSGDARDSQFSPGTGGGGSTGGSISPNPVDTTPPQPPTLIALNARWVTGTIPVSSPILTWTNPSQDFLQSLVALGVTIGGQEITSFNPSLNTSSHVFTQLNLADCSVTYYPSVKAVDAAGNESPAISESIGFRYDSSPPLPVGSVEIPSWDGSSTSAVTVEWSALPGSDNCGISHYQIAVGYDSNDNGIESAEINNVIDWTDLSGGSATTQYKIQNGVDGFTFSPVFNRQYFTSIRVVDEAGLVSPVVTSDGWYTFHPSQLANLSIWLDSQDPNELYQNSACTTPTTTVGQPVGCWRDKSGLVNHAIQAAANTPRLGSRGVDFDGVDDILTISTKTYNWLNNFSMVILFEADIQSNNAGSCCRPIVSFASNSGGLYPWLGLTRGNLVPANNLFHGWIAASLAPRPTSVGEEIFTSVTHNGATAQWNAYSDGVQRVTNQAMANYTSTTVNIGGDNSSAARRLHGQIHEVIVLDRVISDSEREFLEGYLACKYENRDRLDPSHPFYSLIGANQTGCP